MELKPPSDSDAVALAETRARFLSRVDALVSSGAIGEGPVSFRLFGASDRLAEIRAGSDIGVKRLCRALEGLAALEATLLVKDGETEGEAA